MRHLPACFLIATLLSILLPTRAPAQTCSQYLWGETSTRAFTFVYQQNVPLGTEIAAQYGSALDTEYNRLATLFQTALPTPITVRIYPRGADYTCLNALAPAIPTGQTHSHIGAREIALIGQYVSTDPTWAATGFEALRHELAILFAQHLTGGKIPPGLEMGLGHYAEDPALTFDHRLQTTAPPLTAPSMTWRGLWEAPDIILHPDIPLQTASLVAYLIDVHGWEKFVAYLNTLRTAESYRTALTQVYKTDLGTLEEQWRQYYPYYFEGRWRTNILHEFNLTPYEQLLTAGAYQAASDGLIRIINLLTQRGDQPELLAQAQTLLETTTLGLEADALARQAYQAYQEGNYPSASAFAAQALEKYATLNDTRNRETLLTLQTRAAEILALRAELETLQTNLTPAAAPRLLELAPRLGELGDPASQLIAEQMLAQIYAQRQAQATTFALIGIGLGLGGLGFRIFLLRLKTPPEVLVQYDH
ncbi:MAG: hypothetical protein Fur0022_40550 [Anaerolineales bacterium]